MLTEAGSFSDIKSDEVIIVGTIELTPKLGKDEQILSRSGIIDLFNMMDMFRDRCMLQVSSKPEAGGFKTMINPELGKTFFFKIPRSSPYILAGNITIDYPTYGSFDRGVLSVTKVRLVDNYKTALGQFRKK